MRTIEVLVQVAALGPGAWCALLVLPVLLLTLASPAPAGLHADESKPDLDTGVLGGVDGPSADALAQMQRGDYIYRAVDGRLERVPAEKTVLPRDPQGHGQGMSLTIAEDGSLVADTCSILSRSRDGGRTWQSRPIELTGRYWLAGRGDALVCARGEGGEGAGGPIKIWQTIDEGRTEQKIGEIPGDFEGTEHEDFNARHVDGLYRLPDGMLMLAMHARTAVYDQLPRPDGRGKGRTTTSGEWAEYFWHSPDGGRTWQGRSRTPLIWGVECVPTRLPSGRVLTAVRHQRYFLPGDPPDIMARAGAPADGPFPFKHVFLAESDDDGVTWRAYRRLTMHHGQTWGCPVAMADGTLVVIHDTRYGPGEPSGRAMISHDEGRTWQDEVYYLYYGRGVSSYCRSVALDDGTIVTLCGTSDHLEAAQTWDEMVGNTDHTVIRWKPVR